MRVITIYPVERRTISSRTPARRDWSPHLADWVETNPEIVPASRDLAVTVTYAPATLDGDLVALVVDVSGIPDDFATVVQITKQLFDPDVPLAGEPLVSLVAADIAWVSSAVSFPHQIVLLPDRSRTLYGSGTGVDNVERRLRQVLFKDTDIAYDPHNTPVTRPADLAAAEPSRVHVWDSMTVIEGMESVRDLAFFRTRVGEILASNVQVLTARVASVRTRDGVLSLVNSSQTGGRDLEDQLAQLRSFRHLLVRDVGMLVSPLVVRGGRPLLSYHRALVEETGILDSVEATKGVLMDLISVAEFDRHHRVLTETSTQTAQQTQLLSTSKTIRTLGIVFATVSGVFAIVSLVAALAAVPADRAATWSRGLGRAGVLATVTAVAALTLGLLFAHAMGRSTSTKRRAVAFVAAAAAGVAGVVLGIRMWANAPHWVALAFICATAVTGISAAYAIDYQHHSRGSANSL